MSARAPDIRVRGQHMMAGAALFGAVDIGLAAGQWTCVLGPSGVGKTTLLRLIAGLECAGEFEGEIVASDARPIAGRVSFMAQTDLLLPWLTVRENTVLGARLRGEAPDMARAEAMIERVGLWAHRDKTPEALSGGMRQRTALARTLMEDRPMAFLDEPFSALDPLIRTDMQNLLLELQVELHCQLQARMLYRRSRAHGYHFALPLSANGLCRTHGLVHSGLCRP